MEDNLTRADWQREAYESNGPEMYDLDMALEATGMLESLRDIDQGTSQSELIITRSKLRRSAYEANTDLWRERFTTAADMVQDIMDARIKAYVTVGTFDTPGAVTDILEIMGEFDSAAIKAKLEELG